MYNITDNRNICNSASSCNKIKWLNQQIQTPRIDFPVFATGSLTYHPVGSLSLKMKVFENLHHEYQVREVL